MAEIQKFLSTLRDSEDVAATIIDRIDLDKGFMIFRGIEAGDGIVITVDDTDMNPDTSQKKIVISTLGGGGEGQSNTASNVGTGGVGVFKVKSGVDLRFKKINAGSNKITITDDTGNDEIKIDVAQSNLTLTSIGGTLSVAKGGTGATTFTTNSVLLGNGTSAIGGISVPDTSGTFLKWNGSGYVWDVASVAHNSTSSKQGGTTDEYYHLTSAQHTNLTGASTSLTALGLTGNLDVGGALDVTSNSTFDASLDIGVDLDVGGDVVIEGSLTVTGGIVVNGEGFAIEAETIQVSDNLLVLNYGEVGTGVTAGTSGIEVERGSSTNYQFLFNESTDSFEIGMAGELQRVATREDSPTSNGLAIWNSGSVRFDTTLTPTLTSLSLGGGDLNRPHIKGMSEAVTSSTVSNGSTYAVTATTLQSANFYYLTFSGATGAITLPNDLTNSIYIGVSIVTQQPEGGSSTITLPTGVLWEGGVDPTKTTTANAKDGYHFWTVSGGATWFGSQFGKDFKTVA